jgi:hypothetical protein
MRLLAAAIALAVTVAHAAEPLSAQELAKVNREMKKAAEAVSKKYGDKKDLSADDRRAMAREQAEAQRAVLERNNLDPKEVARATAKNGKEIEAEVKALDAKEEKEAKDAEAAKKAGAPSTAAAGATDADANEAAAMDKAKGIGKAKK